MPLPNIAVPQYPNVPQAPGVPPVLRQAGAAQNTAVQLFADGAQVVSAFQNLTAGPQWGIFDGSSLAPVLAGGSVVGVDYRKEFRILDYPIEGGSFASYNKVQIPFDVRVTFSCSGAQTLLSSLIPGGAIGSILTGTSPGAANRAAFLTSLEAAIASLGLVSVVTPEFTYQSCNIVHFDYRRRANAGLTLIVVDVWLQEVRLPPAAQTITVNGEQQSVQSPAAPAASGGSPTGAVQSPDGAPVVNGGTVQGQEITPAQGTALGTGDAPLTDYSSTPGGIIGTDGVAAFEGTATPGFINNGPTVYTSSGQTVLTGQPFPNPNGTPAAPP